MWAPEFSIREVTFLIRKVPFWREWAERKMKEWGITGSPFDHIQRLVDEANKFEGVMEK